MSDAPAAAAAVERVVFDCNIFAQALINPNGSAGQCVVRVLDGEVGRLPDKPTPARLGVTSEKVEALIIRLTPVVHLLNDPPPVYRHPLDPKDSHYIDLAVASNAALVVSRDRHLLGLVDATKSWSADFRARFPHLRVFPPEQLLALLRKDQGQV